MALGVICVEMEVPGLVTKGEKGRSVREEDVVNLDSGFLILLFPCDFLRGNSTCGNNCIFLATKIMLI